MILESNKKLGQVTEMMVRWRKQGEAKLTTVDVRKFQGDTIVIHFGGQLASVDAYTFANSLVSFADTVRSINAQINPGQEIDIRLDAIDSGSFKAAIKQVRKGLTGLFTGAPQSIFWIIATIFIENSIEGTSTFEITEDAVTIQRGGEKIIISKEVFDQYQSIKDDIDVQKNVSKTFEVIERDDAIDNFGLTPKLTDDEPLVQVSRENFHTLVRGPDDLVLNDRETRRIKIHRVTLIVLKPWVNAINRKWSLEWNGVPITAYIRDENFLERVKSYKIRFGNGDAIDVDLESYEVFDENRTLWIADASSYVVKVVHQFIPVGSGEVGLL